MAVSPGQTLHPSTVVSGEEWTRYRSEPPQRPKPSRNPRVPPSRDLHLPANSFTARHLIHPSRCRTLGCRSRFPGWPGRGTVGLARAPDVGAIRLRRGYWAAGGMPSSTCSLIRWNNTNCGHAARSRCLTSSDVHSLVACARELDVIQAGWPAGVVPGPRWRDGHGN